MEESTLYNLFDRCSISTFNVVFYNFQNKQTLNYEQLQSHISEVVENLETEIPVHGVIGCLINQGLTLPAIILGISKISSPFVFLDVYKPILSLKSLQKHIPVKALLCEEELLKDFGDELCSCWKRTEKTILNDLSPLVLLKSSDCCIKTCPTLNIYPNFIASKVSYIIQTSGTTGKPKIVQVPHDCIIPNIIDLRHKFDVTSEDVLLMCSPLTFDPSIIEIFIAILSGCTLVIVPDRLKSVPKIFCNIITDSKVTIIEATPSLIKSFEEKFVKDVLLSKDSILRVLAFGGEVCPSLNKLRKWKSSENQTRLFNLYGLTEVSCWASCYEIDFNVALPSGIPLGEPILDTSIELSEEGEILIGGNKRWCVIDDEVWPDAKSHFMRATGDLATKTPDGLHFIGRKDKTVKYKGKKLSLQGISIILEGIPEILNHYIQFDLKLSILYVFVVQDVKKDPHKMRRLDIVSILRKSISNLPVTEVITVPLIPLTKHGKSDFRKLMDFAKTVSHQSNIYTYTKYVEIISNLWKSYTNQPTVLADDNFILSGGDSFTAAQLAANLEWALQITSSELLNKLLNDSFGGIIELVEKYFFDTEKTGDCRSSVVSCEDELSYAPVPKKRNLEVFQCFEMASRRGYASACTHPNDQACRSNEVKLLSDAKISLKMMCRFDMKKCIDASPCAAYFFESHKMVAFIGSHSGLFYCINVSDKLLEWTSSLPDRIESSPCLSSCGRYVLVGCYDHHLYCVDIKTGTVKWSLSTDGEVKSSPVVSSQNIAYVGSRDKHLYAVKVEGGDLLWKKSISKGSIFSSPALSNEMAAVAVATLDGVLAVLKMDTGAIIWAYNYGKPLFSSPLFASTSVFVGTTNNCILQFDLFGTLVSEHTTNGPVFSSPALVSSLDNEHIIFGCHDCNVYCVNPNSECLWKFCCDSPVYATPYIFQWMQKMYVVVASTSGVIYILSQSNGDVEYFWKCPGEVFSSPVVLNNVLIIGCRDDYVYCFNLSDVI